MAALDEPRRRRLVVEDGDNPMLGEGEPGGLVTFRFPHDLVRKVVYTKAGDARRGIFTGGHSPSSQGHRGPSRRVGAPCPGGRPDRAGVSV